MSDSPERMAERIAAIFDTAWEAQGSELTQTEKLLIGWRTAIAQLAADKRDLQWVEHLGYEICFGMTPIDAPEDFDLLIQHSPRVKEARLRDWSPTMKAVPVLVAEALPSEINFKECPWCIESEPEWSNEAKVWIHRRDSLDKACLNPKFHEPKMKDKPRIYTLKKCPKVGPIRVESLSIMTFGSMKGISRVEKRKP